MKRPCVLVYALAHGTFYPGFRLGKHYFLGKINPGETGYSATQTYPTESADHTFRYDISQIVAPLDYGGIDGWEQPTLVWFDSCFSAGPHANNANYDWRVAQAFGIDGLGWGFYLGCYDEVADFGNDGNGFDTWRRMMWDELTRENVQTAYNHTNSYVSPPPTSGVPKNPGQVYRWTGVGASVL